VCVYLVNILKWIQNPRRVCYRMYVRNGNWRVADVAATSIVEVVVRAITIVIWAIVIAGFAGVAEFGDFNRGISAGRRLKSQQSRKSSTVFVANAHVGDCNRSVRRLWSGDFSDHGRRLPRILRLWSATRANPATTVGDSRD